MNGLERSLRFAGAVVVASLAAGPAFWLIMELGSLFRGKALAWHSVEFAIVTIPYGAIFAFLPNLIGTAIMTALGAWFPMARSFLAWIGAGAVGGLLIAIIFFAALIEEGQLISALILNGMACAAICRAFTRWPDYDAWPDEDSQA